MQCPRLMHFARINYNGTISRCGHMIQQPQFANYEEMQQSQWLNNIKSLMDKDVWPAECERCRVAESIGQTSIRQHELDFYKTAVEQHSEYLVVGGVLDNICNSACQSCNPMNSTKIGSLIDKKYIQINNETAFDLLPAERIFKLDVSGGEPTASPAYQKLLNNLPPNVKYLRVNTNGSKILPNLQNIIDRGVKVTITVSLDGLGLVHDYVRWPIKWELVDSILQEYKKYDIELNTWTTVHALNIGDLKNIIEYTKKNGINHSWALLDDPDVLQVKYSNNFTRIADVPENLKSVVGYSKDNTVEIQNWIETQDRLRGIKIQDYIK